MPIILKYTRLFLSITIVFLMGYIILRNREGFIILYNIQWIWFAPIVFLQYMDLIANVYRFFITIKPFSTLLTYADCKKYFIVGQFLGHFIPQGANIYKSLSLKIKKHTALGKYAASQLYSVLVTLITTLLMGGIIIGWISPELKISGLAILPVITKCLGFLGIVILSIMFIPSITGGSQTTSPRPQLTKISNILQDICYLFFLNKLTILNVTLNILSLGLQLLILFIGFKSLGVHMTWSSLAIFLVIIKLSNILQITPGNIGIRELVFGYLTTCLELNIAVGISLSLILRIISQLTLGVLSLWHIRPIPHHENKKNVS